MGLPLGSNRQTFPGRLRYDANPLVVSPRNFGLLAGLCTGRRPPYEPCSWKLTTHAETNLDKSGGKLLVLTADTGFEDAAIVTSMRLMAWL